MSIEVPALDAHSTRILKALNQRATIINVDDYSLDSDGSLAGGRPEEGSSSSGNPNATHQNFTFMVGVAFSVNYIMGTGFLTLPWAFSQTGYLSFFVVVIITFASICAVHMVLESMARADIYKEKRGNVVDGEEYEELDLSVPNPLNTDITENGSVDLSIVNPTISSFEDVLSSPDTSGSGLEDDSHNAMYAVNRRNPLTDTDTSNVDIRAAEVNSSRYEEVSNDTVDIKAKKKYDSVRVDNFVESRSSERDQNSHGALHMVKARKFEIVEQCSMFLGPALQLTYLCFLCLYMFGTLWAYGTVFANALASNVPIPFVNSYLLYLSLFGCIVVPISCMELEEQILIQVVLSLGRVLMVILMVSSIVISSLWGSDNDFGDEMKEGDDIRPFNINGIHHLLPIAAFAHIFHHSIPALSDPVIDKKELAGIFTATLIFCFFAYTAIGLSVSIFFGSNTLSSSNLNWVHYGHNSYGFSYFMKRVVATFIIMFPGLDVASAFPLNAVTLGNNLFSVVYGKRVHTLKASRGHKIAFRLLGAIPPLIMAAIVSDLGQITDYTGVTGFGIAFIFPSLLSYYSLQKLKTRGLSVGTIYSNFSTDWKNCVLLFIFGIFLCIYVPIALSK